MRVSTAACSFHRWAFGRRGEDDIHRLRHAYQSGQEVGRTRLHCNPPLHEWDGHFGIVGDQPEIAAQRHRHSNPNRIPVHSGDARLSTSQNRQPYCPPPSRCPCAWSAIAPNPCARYAPAQNTFPPAPVMIATLTRSSASKSSKAKTIGERHGTGERVVLLGSVEVENGNAAGGEERHGDVLPGVGRVVEGGRVENR